MKGVLYTPKKKKKSRITLYIAQLHNFCFEKLKNIKTSKMRYRNQKKLTAL